MNTIKTVLLLYTLVILSSLLSCDNEDKSLSLVQDTLTSTETPNEKGKDAKGTASPDWLGADGKWHDPAGLGVEPQFSRDVLPVLMKKDCSTGGCHGAGRGKDGFMLSLFGYDPGGDYFRLLEEYPNRRINLAEPEKSLILLVIV